MAINIQSLFSDIIETPAQRQQRMLTEGILRGRELTGGLTGLARTQAPLVSALAMQMPQRQEAMRRGVGGMLGLDLRTESEKLQDILRQADTSDPQGLRNLARDIRQIAPSQAMTLLQAANEQERKRRVEDIDLETKELALQAARNTTASNAARLSAASNIVAQADSQLAKLMPILYAGDPDGAVSFAEKFISPSAEGATQAKINEYTRILVAGGMPEQEAKDKAIKVANGEIRIELNPDNPSLAFLIDDLEGRVDRINVASNLTTPEDVSEDGAGEPLSPEEEGISILERLQNTTGPFAIASEFLGRIGDATISEDMLDAQRTENQQYLRMIESDIVRSFSLSPRFPEGEQERVRERINIRPSLLAGRGTALARITAIDSYIEEEQKNSQEFLDNPEFSEEEKAKERVFLNSMTEFRRKLLPRIPDASTLTIDAVNNLSKSRVLSFINQYTEEELDNLDPSIRQAMEQKLGGN